MNFNKLILSEKICCFKQLVKFELDIIYLQDIEFKCFIKACKYFIWLSLSYLILRIIYELMLYL